MDKFGFKTLMFIITSIEILIASTLYFSVFNPILYIISILLISACIGGHFSILSPVFNKIFGLEKGPEMYGLTGNFIGVASISGPIMTNFLLKEKTDFLIVFLVGGALCVVKLVVLIFFKEDDQFKYSLIDDLMKDGKNEGNERLITDDNNKED
jgi:MFS-type transporter involved in bile tolerance (Atg22 family)